MGPMLTSESEVDERLRQMNQAVLRALVVGGGGEDWGSEQSSEPDPLLDSVQGSDEVLGRLSLDNDRRRSRGH